MSKITTFITFKEHGKLAVRFYVSIFNNSKLNSILMSADGKKLMNASFSLGDQEFMAMDGGAQFSQGQGVSLFVSCDTQEEVDYYWHKLGQNGQYLQCGWLKDQFGVSWQIIPKALGVLMQDSDSTKVQRVTQAMLNMQKIDIQALQQAHRQ